MIYSMTGFGRGEATEYGNTISAELRTLNNRREVSPLSGVVPFSIRYMKQPLTLDFLWAALGLCGAVFFIFRK